MLCLCIGTTRCAGTKRLPRPTWNHCMYTLTYLNTKLVSFVVLLCMLGHTRTSWASWTSDVYLCSSGGHHLEKRAIYLDCTNVKLHVHCIVQFYSSKQNIKVEKSAELNPNKEDRPEDIIGQLLEEVVHPHIEASHYSTSFCWPSLNNSTLGRHRHQPAQSCQHIISVNVSAPSAFYWIDPNLGCASDAVLVYCNFTSGETCIHTNSSQVGH